MPFYIEVQAFSATKGKSVLNKRKNYLAENKQYFWILVLIFAQHLQCANVLSICINSDNNYYEYYKGDFLFLSFLPCILIEILLYGRVFSSPYLLFYLFISAFTPGYLFYSLRYNQIPSLFILLLKLFHFWSLNALSTFKKQK